MFNPIPPSDPQTAGHRTKTADRTETENRTAAEESTRTRLVARVVFFAILWGCILGFCVALPLAVISRAMEPESMRFQEFARESFVIALLRIYVLFTPSLIFVVGIALVGEVIVDAILYASGRSTLDSRRLFRVLRRKKFAGTLPEVGESDRDADF